MSRQPAQDFLLFLIGGALFAAGVFLALGEDLELAGSGLAPHPGLRRHRRCSGRHGHRHGVGHQHRLGTEAIPPVPHAPAAVARRPERVAAPLSSPTAMARNMRASCG